MATTPIAPTPTTEQQVHQLTLPEIRQLANETIGRINTTATTGGDRSTHKLNLIRISEQISAKLNAPNHLASKRKGYTSKSLQNAADMQIDDAEACRQIVAAVDWCNSVGCAA
ncbi:MAG: hypothetical protein NT069_21990 [Planctomycetota bacterium]|nr:hypothetical protein [Planctomycetota bacterium]